MLTVLKEKLQVLLNRFGLDDAISKSVAKLAGGAVIGQVLTLAASPILSRLYAPEDFGVLGVFTSITSIATMFAALRYEQAIPMADSDGEARDLAVISLIALFCLSAFGILLLLIYSACGKDLELAPAYLLLLPVAICVGSLCRIFTNLIIRAKEYKYIATTRVKQSIGQVVVQLASGVLYPTPLGLVAGFIFGQGGGSLTLFGVVRQQGVVFKDVTADSLKCVARKFKEFPLVLSWAILFNSAAMHLPGVLIAKYYGVGAAGLYYLSRRVLGAPMIMLRMSVSQVYLGEASSLYREAPSELKKLFLKTSLKLFLIGCVICIPAALLSPVLFPFVFGPSWALAGEVTQVLAIYQLFQFTVGPLAQTSIIIGMRKSQLVIDACRFFLAVFSIYLSNCYGLDLITAVGVYVASAVLLYVVNYAYLLQNVRVLSRVEVF